MNLREIITYIRPLIEVNPDNTIDYSEIDAFFTSYNCLNAHHLASAVESTRYKQLYNTSLSIEMTKVPETYLEFYKIGESPLKITVNPF